MRVLFDGYWWADGPISNRTVQREFILTWARLFPEDEIGVVVPRSASKTVGQLPAGTRVFFARSPLQATINIFELPRFARKFRADFVVAHNFSPRRGDAAVFIHDLMFLDHREWFTRAENLYFRAMRWSVRPSTRLYTSSRSEAERIRRLVGVPATPIGLALSTGLVNTSGESVVGLVPNRFLLAVGRLNIRKNLGTVINGAVASGRLSAEQPLAIVGMASGRTESLRPEAEAAIADGRVMLLGSISDAQLKWLYANTRLFIFLSLDEGFGLPCLEARAFGAVSLVSDIDVFHEILGDEATYVDPTDVTAVAERIDLLLASQPLSGHPGAEHEEYSWESSVRRLRGSLIATEGSK